ncbi:MAG: hypothetical protein KDE56_25100 [Anaerolineales bacterium]|nr:hypothetical protein [Anaerolineales bacterium]
MISVTVRRLNVGLAALYGLLGVVLFLAPAWSAANFSWKISPFVAMTMGGWCLGNGYFAWETVRLGRWTAVYLLQLYLGLFGLLETAVLILFRDKLILNVPLALPYILALALTVITAVFSLLNWQKQHPKSKSHNFPTWVRVIVLGFVAFVGLIAFLVLRAQPGGLATEGGAFPEPLTLFTLRAFGSFYTALAIGPIPAIWDRQINGWMAFIRAGLTLVLTILLACLLNFGKFDFASHPGHWLYFGAYVIVAIVAIGLLWVYRPHTILEHSLAEQS